METLYSSPCFIIHLPRHAERVSVYSRIQEAGFQKVQWYEAINGNHRPSVQRAIDRLRLPKLDSRMTSGALGCLLSHLSLLQEIIHAKLPVATIFEDDVVFHPEWSTLSPQYLEKTIETFPEYDVIFLGNQLDSCRVFREPGPMITQESVYCTHGYVVTLEGAKKLLETLLAWDHAKTPYNGITLIDYMIKETQRRANLTKYYPFVWVSWDGTRYPCQQNTLPLSLEHCRNSGLVFQDTRLPTTVQGTATVTLSKSPLLSSSVRTVQKPMLFHGSKSLSS